MEVSATIQNSYQHHQVVVSTEGSQKKVPIAGRAEGYGSSLNGGELLFLALATCFCNDIYREAGKLGLQVDAVEVQVTGEFGAAGEPARNIRYRADIKAPGLTAEEIEAFLSTVDGLAEVHNTLRQGISVERVP